MGKIILTALLALSLVACAGNSKHDEHGNSGKKKHMMHMVSSEFEFLREMIPHHQEAVDSSLLTIERTSRDELRAFAQKIVDAQKAEIADMNSWLGAWYPEQSTKSEYKAMMRPVDGLSADKADQQYLEDMIKHHHMAVMMAKMVSKKNLSDRAEVKEIVQNIISSQNAEIEQMKTWLKDWYGVTINHKARHGMMH